MRKLPDTLSQKQEETKKETAYKIQKAIDELQSEGYIVSRKLLLERTGLSNSVLSKKHCIEVLKENSVCQYAIRKKISKTNANIDKKLEVELNKALIKIEKLEKEKKDLQAKLNAEKVERYALKENNEILRGQMQLLYHLASERGIDLEKLK
jgi:DNA-binding transcriptional MocR family regulator